MIEENKNDIKNIRETSKKLIIERLATLTYRVEHEDKFLLDFCLSKVEDYVRQFCNLREIIINLYYTTIVELTCYEFLMTLKQTNQLEELFNVEEALKTVAIGDTSITYDNSNSTENKLDILLNYLNKGRAGLISYRKIKW